MTATSLKTAISVAEVVPTVRKLCDELSTACVAIEVAGSIRRKRPEVGDIELVAIPARPLDLFGEVDSKTPTQLDLRLRAWHDSGRIAIVQFGPKAKRFVLVLPCRLKIAVDLYTTTPECWPIIFAIRTGPADYAKAFVTPRSRGGLLRNGCYVQGGRLWCEDKRVELRDERHFFEDFVHGGYWPPEDRNA